MSRRMKLGLLIAILQVSSLWAVTFYGTVRDTRTNLTLYQAKAGIEIPARDGTVTINLLHRHFEFVMELKTWLNK